MQKTAQKHLEITQFVFLRRYSAQDALIGKLESTREILKDGRLFGTSL